VSRRNVTIVTGPEPRFELDGHDFTRGVRSVAVGINPGRIGTDVDVTVELAISTIDVIHLGCPDAEVVLSMSDDVREALIALGWKPPVKATANRRYRAREWLAGFREASEDDRVNTVALLLCAADDALECALNHKRTESDDDQGARAV
jgi:hypothetical protein